MTADRDDLRNRLDAVADEVDAEPTREVGPTILREVEDGYETLDGDPIPTDTDGNPAIETDGWGPTVIYSNEVTIDE